MVKWKDRPIGHHSSKLEICLMVLDPLVPQCDVTGTGGVLSHRDDSSALYDWDLHANFTELVGVQVIHQVDLVEGRIVFTVDFRKIKDDRRDFPHGGGGLLERRRLV